MRHWRLSSAACLAGVMLLGAVRGGAQEVSLLGYTATAPSTWTPRTPSSRMRLAEFSTSATVDSSADVVVYFFGEGQGGTAEANMARWKSQFSNPDGSPVVEDVEHVTKGPFPITFASYRGTYARGIGAGSRPELAKPNQALVAAVVETPNGTLFFQMFGPADAVARQRDAYVQFVKGLH